MHKLYLKDFEFNISANTWNTAQDIVALGGVKSLNEVEKHFWVGRILLDEVETYEVEVIITPQRVKAFTCECWTEGRRLICPHIAAVLFKIRQFLEKKVTEKQAKASLRSTDDNPRFTIQTVLNNAEPLELLAFVRDYARKDTDFSLALKTWFATSINGGEQHFAQVLESVLPKIATGKQMREVDYRRLRKVLDDFQTQMEAAEKTGNNHTLYHLGKVILQKICPVLGSVSESRRPVLLELCQLVFQKMIGTEEGHLSPELREGIWTAVMEGVLKHTFPREMEREVIRYMAEKAISDEKFTEIQAIFDKTPSPAPSIILHLYLSALAKRGMERAGITVLDEYQGKNNLVRDAIVHLYYTHYWNGVTAIGEHFLEKGLFSVGQKREIEDMLLQIAEKQNDKKRLLVLYRKRLLASHNFDYYQKMKAVAGNKWDAEMKKVLEAAQLKKDSKLIVAILAEEEQWLLVAAFIEKEQSLSLLQHFEGVLIKNDKILVRNMYIELLSDYLRHHFGRTASAYVRGVLIGLVQKGEHDLVMEIARDLMVGFGDRDTLGEELVELFPKNMRKAFLQAV